MICNLNNVKINFNLFDADENNRTINIYELKDVIPVDNHSFYPSVLLKTDDGVVSPINESIMSLKDLIIDTTILKINEPHKSFEIPCFFFIYNTENYYHFIYDTLPYLISYFEVKKKIPEIKLLMNFPNRHKKENYKFVLEFLELLSINNSDIEIIDTNTRYKTIFVSSSYTHDGMSNLPPRKEIFKLYSKIIENALLIKKIDTPKKIYISRRTWVHNEHSNIGTNYTTRRKLINEDELVDYLTKIGYTEVFTETLSTVEKINYFLNATDIIGPIGGGLCNVLFSKPSTNLIVIESPGFFNINQRFIYSLNNVKLTIYNKTYHSEKSKFKKFMRVNCNNIIGEVISYDKNELTISHTNEFVAGWNNDVSYNTTNIKRKFCKKLDNGLNSPWYLNLIKLKKYAN